MGERVILIHGEDNKKQQYYNTLFQDQPKYYEYKVLSHYSNRLVSMKAEQE